MKKTKKKNPKLKTEVRADKLATSLLVILFYFMWPFIINFLKDIFNIGDDFVFGIVCNLLLIIVLIFIYKKDLKEYALNFKKNRKKSIKTILIYSLISIIAVALINSVVINVLNINHITENDSSLFKSFETYPLLVAFLTVIYYPIVEEIVFEKTLKDVISNKWLFILLSALFFWYYNIAYTGGITYITIVSSLYYFVLGFIRALSFYKTDNLYIPICIKSLYNLFVTIIS